MNLVIFTSLFILTSVVCIDEIENDQSAVKSSLNFNHSPTVEVNPIPVSVIYEDDVTVGKSSKSVSEEIPNIEEISSTIEDIEELITTERINVKTIDKTNKPDVKLDDIPVKPKARALSEYQIPVAVVYDSVPDKIQTSQLSENGKKSPRRKLKQRRRLEKQSNKENAQNNDDDKITQESQTEKVDAANPENLIPIKRQHQRVDFVNIQTTKKPRPTSVESAKPQPQKASFVYHQTERKENVKPQPRKIESVNPQLQRVESNTREPSSFETKSKGDQRKRERDPVVRIVESENQVFAHNGNFHYSYESADGTKAFSEGHLLKTDNYEAAGEAVSGGFSYTDKEGNDFSLSYTADENGYQPVGAHLPTPPPIPPAIARALAYLATATTPEPVTKPTVKKTN